MGRREKGWKVGEGRREGVKGKGKKKSERLSELELNRQSFITAKSLGVCHHRVSTTFQKLARVGCCFGSNLWCKKGVLAESNFTLLLHQYTSLPFREAPPSYVFRIIVCLT